MSAWTAAKGESIRQELDGLARKVARGTPLDPSHQRRFMELWLYLDENLRRGEALPDAWAVHRG